MTVTSADVARHAGVSRATVSQVLNGHAERFAPATVARVHAAATELDYQPSVAGRALRRGSSDIIIAILPNTTFGTNMQDMLEPMTEALAEKGYTLVLRTATRVPGSLDRVVGTLKPAAVFSLTQLSDDDRACLARRGVLALAPPSGMSDHNFAIGCLQAETLIRHGHRRLVYAHLRDNRDDPYGAAREEGFVTTASELGVPDVQIISLDVDRDSAVSALARIEGPGVAIACYNDDVALALMTAVRLRGWGIPQDVALIGMDNVRMAGLALPRLATFEYDLLAAAQYATRGLLHMFGGGALDESMMPIELTYIPGETI